jgi:predicted ABC-type ATPase
MPTLTVLAGPNGAGKSVFSEFLLNRSFLTVKPYNLDVINWSNISDYLSGNVYSMDNEIAKLKHKAFTKACENAINENNDFSFECNLRKSQLINVNLFEQANYKLNLIYIFLDDIQTSYDRVKHRVDVQKGNFVDNESIKHNFENGLKNLDKSFNDWDSVVLFDNSKNIDLNSKDWDFKLCLSSVNNVINYINEVFPPDSLKNYIPNISKKIDLFRN